MLTDLEIKQAVYGSWFTEPKRPPRVDLAITDEVIFAVDENMYVHASRKINLSQTAYTMAIRHELRHLTVAPVYWNTWATWAVQLAKQGYKETDIQQILNIYCDLLVNYSLIKDYPAAFDQTFRELLKEYWTIKPYSAWLLLYLRAHEHKMGTNYVSVPAHNVPFQGIAKGAVEISFADFEADALKLKLMFEEEEAPDAERLAKAARLIAPYLKDEDNSSFPESHGKGQGQPRSSQEARERLAEKAEEHGLTPGQAREAMNAHGEGKCTHGYGGKPVDTTEAVELLDQAKASRLYSEAIKVVACVRGHTGLNVALPEIWRIGDAPDRLDVEATVSRFGVVIPNITALKTTSFQLDRPVWGDRGAKICIAVDESGSVSSNVWNRECEAAVGLAAYALEKKMPVYACKFDEPTPSAKGYVEFSGKLSYNYWELMRWLVRRRLSGGTAIQQVFEAIVQVPDVEGATVVVLTDCGIGELNKARSAMKALAIKKICFRVFMIGEASVPTVLKETFAGYDAKFYAVPNVNERLTEDAVNSVT